LLPESVNTIRSLYFFFALLFLVISPASGDEVVTLDLRDPFAALTITTPRENRIPSVRWSEGALVIERELINGDIRYFTVIDGTVNTKQITKLVFVIDQGKPQTIYPKRGEVHFKVLVTKPLHQVFVYSDVDHYYSKGDTLEIRSDMQTKNISPWHGDIGTSLSALFYREIYGPTEFRVNEIGLTVKGGVTYTLSPDFNLGLSAFGTVYPLELGSTPSDLSPSRFYGVNGRIGYRLVEFAPHKSLTLMAGWQHDDGSFVE
jgi:hypothetical protein